MRKMWKALAGMMLALIICFGAGTAPAETTMHREADDPSIEMTAEIGYRGEMTYGKAMPLRVRIRNNGASDLEGTLGINAYLDARRYNRFETNISVPSGAEKEYVLPFSVMSRQDIFTPEIVADGRVVEAVNLRIGNGLKLINPGTMLVGVLSTKPKRLSGMNINAGNDTEYIGEYWQTVELDRDSFPDQAALLDAFALLVIDDIDPASLSEKQQEALKQWTEGGHILLCSGSAANVAYFADRTGLEMTGTVTSRKVLAALENLIGVNPSGARKQVALSRLAGAAPLVSDEEGNGLVYRTVTGNGRIYTTAYEMGESGLLNEGSMHYFWRKVLTACDSSLYYDLMYSYGNDGVSAIVYPDSTVSVPVRSLMPAALAIAAGVLVLACAAWLILKKTGRQTWMWLVVPGLAAAAAAGILIVSGASGLNKPMVTYTENIIQTADGSTTRYIGVNAAAAGTGMHSYRIDGAPISIQYNQNMYYDEDTEAPSEPTEMVMCFTTGSEERLSLLTDTPWEAMALQSESALAGFGRIDAEAWMEEDGLHGEIRNGTDYTLKAGKVITSFGFVSVPALEPGEKTAFAMKKATLKSGAVRLKDGEIYMNSGVSLYNVYYAALGLSEEVWEENGPLATQRDIIAAALNRITGGNIYDSSLAAFLYTTGSEELRPQAFFVDGSPVKNVAGNSTINVEISYSAAGKTGMVCRMPGMDRAVQMQVDENGLPDGETESSQGSWYYGKGYSLSDCPVFRFTLDPPSDVEVTSLYIMLQYYGSQVRCSLLNAGTGEWDRVRLNAAVSSPATYVDGNGYLFCRIEPDGLNEYDMTVDAPTLSMEGRILHAED